MPEQEQMSIVTEQNVYGDIQGIDDQSELKLQSEDVEALIEASIVQNSQVK